MSFSTEIGEWKGEWDKEIQWSQDWRWERDGESIYIFTEDGFIMFEISVFTTP